MNEKPSPVSLPPGWPTGTATPEDFIKAHQYLYYVKSDPVWDDFKYDQYCKEFGLFGGGGSDSAKDYPEHIVKLAEGIWRYHQKDKVIAPKPRKPRGKKTAPKTEEISFV